MQRLLAGMDHQPEQRLGEGDGDDGDPDRKVAQPHALGTWKGAPRRQRVAAVRGNRACQRLHENIGVPINQSVTVSLTGERLPSAMRARMASQTWSTLIWSMQERSQGQSFHPPARGVFRAAGEIGVERISGL